MHQNNESPVLKMMARVASNPADSFRRRDGRSDGRRERANMPHKIQHRMIQMNRELTNFH
jgi:hypothetical protein